MSRNNYVIEGGMIPFVKSGANVPFPEMAASALCSSARATSASNGYALGASTAGQRALFEVDMAGIPAAHVNNCSTGASALFPLPSGARWRHAECPGVGH